MADFRQRPFYESMARNTLADERRRCASSYSSDYAAVATQQNTDEDDLQDQQFLASFTKGLPHNEFGNLADKDDYIAFVNEINKQDASNFDDVKRGLIDPSSARTERKADPASGEVTAIDWRGWESPRSGHYFDLQGPDADAVGMPAAPNLGSAELIGEMGEVYALALLRDVPFSDIALAVNDNTVTTMTNINVQDVLQTLSELNWFSDSNIAVLSLQERRRRAARRVDHGSDFPVNEPPDAVPFSAKDAFRGSGPGAKAGPYVSQFMLLGNRQEMSGSNIVNASVAYGRQVIDQKIETLAPGKDYMVHWNAFVDVQNGADFRSDTDAAVSTVPDQRRFITTPRDLAAYVRYDALYQAYLNACLFMLGRDSVFSTQAPVKNPYGDFIGPGFPDGLSSDPNKPASRQAFATFGGPHILSLVTEVATRCLKAVRRQKFNYHRRARPERIGGLLAIRGTFDAPNPDDNVSGEIDGSAAGQINTMLSNLGDMLQHVNDHNNELIPNGNADPHLDFTAKPDASWYSNTSKLLLPMAFAEGSPMHPSYGAGHATVAGGCVTMLKAFFNTTDADGNALPWPTDPELTPMQGVLTNDPQNPSQLEPATNIAGMTITGELNKLAANISIGRNMAGVHYYTDYYESLRMGERIATGILIEQMKQYNEPVEFSFESFDGDHVHILKNDYDYGEARVYIHMAADENGDRTEVTLDDWWHRHTIEDDASAAIAFAEATSQSNSTRTAKA